MITSLYHHDAPSVVCGVQVCSALSRRTRRPLVQLEFPLVAGVDADDVEAAKTQLLRALKESLGLTRKADDAPVSDRHLINREGRLLSRLITFIFSIIIIITSSSSSMARLIGVLWVWCAGGDPVCHVSGGGGGRGQHRAANNQ